MSIARGTRFGPYEIAALIGVGGMGEVYRATDTNLKRDVALKVLPETFATDADTARAVAARSRSVGLAQSPEHRADLRPRARHGDGRPRSRWSWSTARHSQIGSRRARCRSRKRCASRGRSPTRWRPRTSAASCTGISSPRTSRSARRHGEGARLRHREGTRRARGRPARAWRAHHARDDRSRRGARHGRVHEPEQASGKSVDRRTDIWAFGCVLYEMLTGQAAFLGEDVDDHARARARGERRSERLPSDVSPSVRRTLELCLEKDARKRIADMRDVRLALAGAFALGDTPAAPLWRRALPSAATLARRLAASRASISSVPGRRPHPLSWRRRRPCRAS